MRASHLFPTCRERHRKRDADVGDENLSFVIASKYFSPSESNIAQWGAVGGSGVLKALKGNSFKTFIGENGNEVGKIGRASCRERVS